LLQFKQALINLNVILLNPNNLGDLVRKYEILLLTTSFIQVSKNTFTNYLHVRIIAFDMKREGYFKLQTVYTEDKKPIVRGFLKDE